MILSILSLLLGICIFYYFFKKTGDYFNPIGIVSFSWLSVASLYFLKLSSLQTNVTLQMVIIVFLFPISFSIGGCFFCSKENKYHELIRFEFSHLYILVTRIMFIICVVCAFVEWRAQGYMTLLTFDGLGDAKESVKAIPIIHYGTFMLPYMAIISIFELFYREGKKKRDIIFNICAILFIVFHTIFITMSRGALIIPFLAMIFFASRKYKVKLLYICTLLVVLALLFLLIAQKRLVSSSLVFSNVDGYPVISAIYSYSAINLENLNRLTANGPHFYVIGRTFRGVLELIGLDGLFAYAETEKTVFFNATPLCYDFYDDLGIIGVVIFSVFFGMVINWIYKKSIIDSRYTLLYAIMQKAIWMNFFGNYFTGYRILMFPYLVVIILIYLFDKKFIEVKNGKQI